MRRFDRDYIETELRRLAPRLDSPVEIYVIGGGAMAFRDLKQGTKDLDVVLATEREARALVQALEAVGYEAPEDLSGPYEEMGTRQVLENDEGFRWDVLVREVMGFGFSDRMMDRAEWWTEEGPLAVRAAANEDLFTFKALTSRRRDRDDMAILWAAGLDADVIREEVRAQAENPTGKRFAAFFYQGVREFAERTGAEIPDMELYERLHDREVLADAIHRRLDDGPTSIGEIADRLEAPEEQVREAVQRLERQDLIEVDGDTLAAPE